MRPTLCLFFLFACHPAKEKSPELYGDYSSADPLADISGLPSLSGRIDTTHCDEKSEEFQTPGATSYFTGTYVLVEGEWIGREKWLLFPNEYWEAEGGETCEIVWEMTAYESELSNCLACDMALNVGGEVHLGSTNCPEGLWSDPAEQSWNATYEIATLEEETIFYYLSGTVLGEGYANEKALSFLTEPDCKWF